MTLLAHLSSGYLIYKITKRRVKLHGFMGHHVGYPTVAAVASFTAGFRKRNLTAPHPMWCGAVPNAHLLCTVLARTGTGFISAFTDGAFWYTGK